MEKEIAVRNYYVIFIIATILYVLSLAKFIAGGSDWTLFAFSLLIMFLSLWGSVIAKKLLGKKKPARKLVVRRRKAVKKTPAKKKPVKRKKRRK
jgi:hypothetical protein